MDTRMEGNAPTSEGPARPGEVIWIANSLRPTILAREKWSRVAVILGLALFCSGLIGSILLARASVDLPLGVWELLFAAWVIGIWPLAIGGALLRHPTSGYTPVRVGVSTSGIEVEYDPSTEARRRARDPWAATSLEWADLAYLQAMPVLYGPPTILQMKDRSDHFWQVAPVSNDIVSMATSFARAEGVPSS